MLTIVKGDDTINILNYIKSLKNRYKDDYEYSNAKLDKASFIDLISSNNLFFSNKLIVVRFSTPKLKLDKEALQKALDNKNTLVVLVIGNYKVDLDTRVLRKSELKEFNLPKNYVSFRISDAIIVENNKKKALQLVSGVENIEEEFYSIVGAVSYGLRCYFSVSYKNKFYKSLRPFVVKKYQNLTRNEDHYKKMYKSLSKLDLKSKTEYTPLKALLCDFILEVC